MEAGNDRTVNCSDGGRTGRRNQFTVAYLVDSKAKTPAMRLGLAKAPVALEDILYFSPTASPPSVEPRKRGLLLADDAPF